MTTYTVKIVSTPSGRPPDWGDPATWVGGVVADSPDADVTFDMATVPSTGELVAGNVTIGAGKTYTIGSIVLPGNILEMNGVLSVDGAVTLQEGSLILLEGTLSAESLENSGSSLQDSGQLQGSGQLQISGSLTNRGGIAGFDLDITATSFTNLGSIGSSGHTTLTVPVGGFSNLSGSTLTGGTYGAFGGTLSLKVGGVITDLAATLVLTHGGDLLSFDSTAGDYVSIQSSLQSIAAAGFLSLTRQTFNADTLSVDGKISLSDQSVIHADQLVVHEGGQIQGTGTIDAPVHNDSAIRVTDGGLTITGPVTGAGTLYLAGGIGLDPFRPVGPGLRLAAATSQSIVFENPYATLVIDDPAHFTGTITPPTIGSAMNRIILMGMSLAGLESYSYAGDASGGVLSLHQASGTTDLHIVGDFATGSFQFSSFPTAGSPSLVITVGGKVSLVNDTGLSSTDGITTDPTITGRAGFATGIGVQLTIDGTKLDTFLHADAQGRWTYTPSGLADGVHTIVAREIAPGLKGSFNTINVSSITFTIDTALDAHADAYVATPGHTIVMGAADGVLANDHTPAGAPATAALVTGPAHGSIALAADGGFTYTPDPGFAGIDRFSYSATTGSGAGDSAEVMLHVAPVNVGTSTTLGLTELTAAEQVAATYVAFFGRIADLGGFTFWLDEFNSGLASQGPVTLFANIASSFGISDEGKDIYPFLAHPASASDAEIGTFLGAVYDNLFNRAPDAPGLAYWTAQIKQTLAAGQFVGSVLIDIMSGAQDSADGHDITTLMAKVAVSLSYLETDPGLVVPWSDGGVMAKAVLDAVTDAPQSVLVGIVDAHTLATTGHL